MPTSAHATAPERGPERDVRATYVGGFNGQLVAGVLWLVAAAAGAWASPAWATVTLLLGGTLIAH